MGILDIRTASVCKTSDVLCPHWAITRSLLDIYKAYADFERTARQST